MEHPGRRYLLWSFWGTSIALLLGCGLLALWLYPLKTRELDAARSRWAARPFSHYRLVIEYGQLRYCRQSVEVADEQVVAILENTCSEPTPTVTDLFERIERDIATVSGRCGPNGCGCDGTIGVSAAYDPTLGYPQHKEVQLRPRDRWRFPDYWMRRLSGQLCTSWELGHETITVISLTPLL
jgi:hypothetical protein